MKLFKLNLYKKKVYWSKNIDFILVKNTFKTLLIILF
jgi:hypothetical protein